MESGELNRSNERKPLGPEEAVDQSAASPAEGADPQVQEPAPAPLDSTSDGARGADEDGQAGRAAVEPGDVPRTDSPGPMAAADSPRPDGRTAELVKTDLRRIEEHFEQRFQEIETSVASLRNDVSLIPAQVRRLGRDVSDIATSLSETRLRSLLLDVVRIYDLTDQMIQACDGDPGSSADGRRQGGYEILRTQIRQILQANGLAEIPCDGVFNPELHRAMRRVPCDNAEMNNRVFRVVRTGFRTERSVLRYAEVELHWFDPALPKPPAAATPKDAAAQDPPPANV